MEKLNSILSMWEEDSQIDATNIQKEIIKIPSLHNKYLSLLSKAKMQLEQINFKYLSMRKIKNDYYLGYLSEEDLKKYDWPPFEIKILKKDVDEYIESDEDIQKILANKILYEQIVDCCHSILKELHSRTFQLKTYVEYTKFLSGA